MTYMFIQIDGIKGESQDQALKDSIEITKAEWGAAQAVAMSSGVKSCGGRVNLSKFSFRHFVDCATPLLFQTCCTGAHLVSATLTIREHGTKGTGMFDLTRVTLTDVMVTDIATVPWMGDDQDAPLDSATLYDTPQEDVHLSFRKIEIDSIPAGQGAIHGGWDLSAVLRA